MYYSLTFLNNSTNVLPVEKPVENLIAIASHSQQANTKKPRLPGDLVENGSQKGSFLIAFLTRRSR